MPTRIYLAGPMSGLKYEQARGWRQHMAARLPEIEWLDPMRGLEILATRRQRLMAESPAAGPFGDGRASLIRDLHDVRTSDLVMANLLGAKKVSIGTMVEYGWASALNIPILTVMEDEGNPHDHPFISHNSVYMVPSIDQAVELISVWFNSYVAHIPP